MATRLLSSLGALLVLLGLAAWAFGWDALLALPRAALAAIRAEPSIYGLIALGLLLMLLARVFGRGRG